MYFDNLPFYSYELTSSYILIIFPFTAGGPPLPLRPARQVPARSTIRASRASLEDPHLYHHPGPLSGHFVGR